MSLRCPASWLWFIAALVIALGTGSGLPGLVRALSPAATHVCMCASGGSHASCPVCNPSLGASHSRHRALRGVPCGEERRAIGEVCEFGIVPQAAAVPISRFERALSAHGAITWPEMPDQEPVTPPPRVSAAV